jgi:hypothetical protein
MLYYSNYDIIVYLHWCIYIYIYICVCVCVCINMWAGIVQSVASRYRVDGPEIESR